MCRRYTVFIFWTHPSTVFNAGVVFVCFVAICWDRRVDRRAGRDDRSLYSEAGWGSERSEAGRSHRRWLCPRQQDGKSFASHTERHCVHCLALHTLRDENIAAYCVWIHMKWECTEYVPTKLYLNYWVHVYMSCVCMCEWRIHISLTDQIVKSIWNGRWHQWWTVIIYTVIKYAVYEVLLDTWFHPYESVRWGLISAIRSWFD